MIGSIIFDMGNVLLTYTPREYVNTIIEDKTAAEAITEEEALKKILNGLETMLGVQLNG